MSVIDLVCEMDELKKSPPVVKPRRAMGAVVSAQELFIAIVDAQSTQDISLIGGETFSIPLRGRSTEDVRAFMRKIKDELVPKGGNHIALRAGATRGLFTTAPIASKIEAILQLTSKLNVSLINTYSINRWADRTPVTIKGLHCGRLSRPSQKAIETAAFYALNSRNLTAKDYADGY